MKYLLPLLIVPVIAFAQGSAQKQPTKQDFFDNVKGNMQKMMAMTIPAMEKTQSCLQQAGDKAALNQCVEIMAAVQRKMMGAKAKGHGQQLPPTPEIEWSPELKEKMLVDLSRALKESNVTKGCFETSADPDQMDACMKKTGLVK